MLVGCGFGRGGEVRPREVLILDVGFQGWECLIMAALKKRSEDVLLEMHGKGLQMSSDPNRQLQENRRLLEGILGVTRAGKVTRKSDGVSFILTSVTFLSLMLQRDPRTALILYTLSSHIRPHLAVVI